MKRIRKLLALLLVAAMSMGGTGIAGTEVFAAEPSDELLISGSDEGLLSDGFQEEAVLSQDLQEETTAGTEELIKEAPVEEDAPESIKPDKGADYKLWVGGVQVTDDNKNDLSEGFKTLKSASYDPSTNTLTIHGNATFAGNHNGALIYAEQPLTIKGEGINMFSTEKNEATDGIILMGAGNDLTLDGHIVITGDFGGYGIYCEEETTIGKNAQVSLFGSSFTSGGDVTIEGGKLSISDSTTFGEGLTCSDGNIYINGGEIDIEVGQIGISAAGDTEEKGNIFIRNPIIVKSKEKRALHAGGKIVIDRGNYYINKTGAKIVKKATCTTITDADGNDLKSVEIRKESDSDKYDLWVGGVQVTEHWLHDLGGITKGSATYDPASKTLTLNNVEGFEGVYEKSCIYTKDDLTIDGKADIKTAAGDLNVAINGTKDLSFKGSFDLGHLSPVINYGIRAQGDIYTYAGCNLYIFSHSDGIKSGGNIEFDGGTVISDSEEANGIVGTKGILIDGADVRASSSGGESHYGICSQAKIDIQSGILKAMSTAHNGRAIQANGGLTIDKSLKIVKPESGASVKDGTVVDKDGKPVTELEIEPPIVMYYSVWIGKTEITDLNAPDVLGDGKISYDADTNTLTLNNVTDFGELNTEGCAITAKRGLIVKGSAAIPNSAKLAILVDSTEPLIVSADIKAPGVENGIVSNGDITLANAAITINSKEQAIFSSKNIVIEKSDVELSQTGTHDTLEASGTIQINESKVKTVSNGAGRAIFAAGGIVLGSDTAIYEPEYGMLKGDKTTVLNADYTDAKSVLIDRMVNFTVKFDAKGHGSAPADETVLKGMKVSDPGPLTETGWKFMGWYSDSACTVLYDFATPVNENMTLYAKWVDESVKTYKVDFNLGGKPGTPPASQIVEEGGKAVKPGTDPVAVGWIFAGWYLNGSKYDFDSPVVEDMILTAEWRQEGTFTVRLKNVATDPYEGIAKADGKYMIAYTGDNICPAIEVFGATPGDALIEGEDYTVKYGNNKKVTTGKPATVTISGKGIYKGKKTIEFSIVPADLSTALSKGMLEISGISAVSGSKAAAAIIYNGYTLKSGDYALTNTSKITSDGQTTDIKGKGNFTGTVTGQAIKCLDKDSTKKLTLKAKINASKVYNGYPIELSGTELTVTNGNKEVLTLGADYSVSYVDNVHSGTARAVIKGKGEYLAAKSVTVTFKITPLKTGQMKVTPQYASVEYSPAGATDPLNVECYSEKYDTWYSLKNGVDYTVKYSSNKKTGKGKYTVNFTGDYKGHSAIKGEYEIKAADISGASVVVPDMTYIKKGKYLQAPIVTIDSILLSSKDYDVKYYDYLTGELLKDPIELTGSETSKSIRVEVTGKGNLTGTCWEIYSIEKPEGRIDLTGAKITVVKSEEFSGEPVQPMVTVQVNGQTIPSSKYHVGYANNKYKGTAIVYVEGDTVYTIGSSIHKFGITPKDILSFLFG